MLRARLTPVTSASAFGRVLTDIDATINPNTRDIVVVSATNRLVSRSDSPRVRWSFRRLPGISRRDSPASPSDGKMTLGTRLAGRGLVAGACYFRERGRTMGCSRANEKRHIRIVDVALSPGGCGGKI